MNEQQTLALELALAWIKAQYQPIGIVVSGSIVRGNSNSGSDFDIVVLHEQPFRQRVQRLFNGVPCEIFVNPPAQMHRYFEQELRANRPVSAHMLATGQVVLGGDQAEVVALLAAAGDYAAKAPVAPPAQKQLRQYSLATLVEDAEDMLAVDAATARYILDKAALEAIDFVFWTSQQPLPRLKERLRSLADLHPAVGSLLLRYYGTGLLVEKLASLKQSVELLAGHTAFFEWSSVPEPC